MALSIPQTNLRGGQKDSERPTYYDYVQRFYLTKSVGFSLVLVSRIEGYIFYQFALLMLSEKCLQFLCMIHIFLYGTIG